MQRSNSTATTWSSTRPHIGDRGPNADMSRRAGQRLHEQARVRRHEFIRKNRRLLLGGVALLGVTTVPLVLLQRTAFWRGFGLGTSITIIAATLIILVREESGAHQLE